MIVEAIDFFDRVDFGRPAEILARDLQLFVDDGVMVHGFLGDTPVFDQENEFRVIKTGDELKLYFFLLVFRFQFDDRPIPIAFDMHLHFPAGSILRSN